MNQSRILITGASSGIGAALARSLSKDHHVFACGRDQAKLNNVLNDNMTALTFDVCDKTQIVDAAKPISDLELLILNAGDCRYIDDAVHFDDVAFESVIKTNLISLGYCLNVFLPKLKPNGQIVIVGSSVTYFPFARAEAYGASKAGVKYLAQSLQQSLAHTQYKVTLVEPGFVATPLTAKNDFAMPFLISAEQAADVIVRGIKAKKRLIRFPRALIILLKFFALLPAQWSAKLTQRKP